jgi:hypothetical protein
MQGIRLSRACSQAFGNHGDGARLSLEAEAWHVRNIKILDGYLVAFKRVGQQPTRLMVVHPLQLGTGQGKASAPGILYRHGAAREDHFPFEAAQRETIVLI